MVYNLFYRLQKTITSSLVWLKLDMIISVQLILEQLNEDTRLSFKLLLSIFYSYNIFFEYIE